MATSLSFQSWARDSAEESSLKDVLARVNLERGHFRDITEASLQEEIAGEGALELSSSEEEDEGDKEEERSATKRRPTTRDELFKYKVEMLQHIYAAEQDVLMSLDFISLLESKYEPGRASSTISPVLKSSVPTGSLGMDIWHRMPSNTPGEAQESILATNVRMECLQQSADSLLEAAARLQDNLRKEQQYWEQILSVSARGWSLLRLSRRSNRLGVHLGFNPAAPELANRNVAALDTDANGNCTLEPRIGSGSKTMKIVIRNSDSIVGLSGLRAVHDTKDDTLESRIRRARDSLYDEELYHEMMRESRSLASLGVTTTDSALKFTIPTSGNSQKTTVSFQLVLLEDNNDPGPEVDHEYDHLAQAMLLAARILLSQSHREKLKEKSQIPPPLSEKTDQKPPFPILRTLISLPKHAAAIHQLNTYLTGLGSVLESANIRTAYSKANMDILTAAETKNTDVLVNEFIRPFQSSASFTIHTPSLNTITLDFGIDTSLAYGSNSSFIIRASPTQTFRLSTIGDLSAATDGVFISVLAKGLHETLPNEWKCNAREGILRRVTDILSASPEIRIELDSAEKNLALVSNSTRVTWTVDEREAHSFWDSWKDIIDKSA